MVSQRDPQPSTPLPWGRVLLHPLWLLALALLALNDHLWKGSGLLPPWLTGKLSDFAGLLVAPALLGYLLRVRRGATWRACHAAVGGVFALLKLSPTVAATSTALLGAVGIPFHPRADPSDLLALPMLALSSAFFGRRLFGAVASAAPAWPNGLRRGLSGAVAAVALVFCTATSPKPDPSDYYVDIQADVYLHNATDGELFIRLYEVLPDVQLDCFEVATDPVRHLGGPIYAAARTWIAPPHTNIPAWDHALTASPRDCYAVRLEIDGLQPQVLFWQNGRPPVTSHPGESDSADLDTGAVAITVEAERLQATAVGEAVAFPLVPANETPTAACAALPEADRLAWSEPLPRQERIVAVDSGPDGCLGISLQDSAAATAERFYLCMPEAAWPFAVGDRVHFADFTTSGGPVAAPAAGLSITLVERPAPVEPAPPAAAAPASLVVRLVRGAGIGPQPTSADIVAVVEPRADCPVLADACGSVGRNARVLLANAGGAELTLAPGESGTLALTAAATFDVHVVQAAVRDVLNAPCSPGSDAVGSDLEVVTVEQVLAPARRAR